MFPEKKLSFYDESGEWAYARQSSKSTPHIAHDLQKRQTSGVDPRNAPLTIKSASSRPGKSHSGRVRVGS